MRQIRQEPDWIMIEAAARLTDALLVIFRVTNEWPRIDLDISRFLPYVYDHEGD